MKIALIGASGNAGSRIAAELAARGHAVTAIARNAGKIAALPGVSPLALDLSDTDALVDALKGHDVVVSSVHFTATDPDQLIAAVKASGVPRYAVVGGAGSLEVAPGVRLIDTPQFPAEYREEAEKGGVFLDRLRQEKDLDWTFLSPSAAFVPGERTGAFRLGGDELLTTAAGSSISFEDYAIALADEIETPRHSRRRFTVGY
ncbi:NAD(P)-dependent oxidoreductase [uncultured Aureimonas sp.]|uniref:NAD(P)-dependent oxidoreductase n=1 Tax=uncultured Aureimonas sp. TaxID=1604662 RepID=UPI0025DFC9D4|nr:NAD(P)-dependent oxidoreductase [uncultured Aureimonas sp.]